MSSASRTHAMMSGSFGRDLFMTVIFVELFAMAVLTPVATAGMVCGEREANTLGLLFLTRLKPWNIVQDKGLSRVTFMLALCAVTLPFMFTALLFGGVEPGQIVAAAGNILAVILFSGGVSLLFSTVARRFGAALAMSFCAMFLYFAVLPVCLLMWRPSAAWMGVIATINPFFSTGMMADPYDVRSNSWLMYSWISNLLVGVTVYVVAVALASRLLKRIAFSESAPAPTGRRFLAGLRKNPFPFHPAAMAHRGPSVGEKPVIWKESNLLDDSLKTVLLRISDLLFAIYVGLLCLVAVNSWTAPAHEEVHLVGHAAAFVILSVFVAIISAASFARERESGTFDVLLTTRLSGRDIVWGTFVGVVRSVVPFAAILLWILLIGVAATSDLRKTLFATAFTAAGVGYILPFILRPFQANHGFRPGVVRGGAFLAALLLAVVGSSGAVDGKIGIGLPLLNTMVYFGFIIVVGMYMSLECRTTAKATGWTLSILLSLGVVMPILALMMGEGLNRGFGRFLFACCPDYWIAVGPWNSEHFEDDCGGVGGYVAVTVAYAGIAFGLLVHMMRSFDRRVGRQSGR